MALKDLISDSGKVTEEAVEKIVAPYVGYDVKGKTITLRPAFGKLGSKQKVLVYLVALQGWPFVTDSKDISTSVPPAELQKKLSIPGGTLRPLLRDLSDAHIISENTHRYSVEPAGLYEVSAIIDGSSEGGASPRKRKAKKKRSAK